MSLKPKGSQITCIAIYEAIRTAQFIRNKAVRFWMDNSGIGQKDLYRLAQNTLEMNFLLLAT
ncbi:transposase [Arthrospira sp. PCC 8006]|nr:transposase [Arthrospira platensis YZ]